MNLPCKVNGHCVIAEQWLYNLTNTYAPCIPQEGSCSVCQDPKEVKKNQPTCGKNFMTASLVIINAPKDQHTSIRSMLTPYLRSAIDEEEDGLGLLIHSWALFFIDKMPSDCKCLESIRSINEGGIKHLMSSFKVYTTRMTMNYLRAYPKTRIPYYLLLIGASILLLIASVYWAITNAIRQSSLYQPRSST